jgi:hypothetical protein
MGLPNPPAGIGEAGQHPDSWAGQLFGMGSLLIADRLPVLCATTRFTVATGLQQAIAPRNAQPGGDLFEPAAGTREARIPIKGQAENNSLHNPQTIKLRFSA